MRVQSVRLPNQKMLMAKFKSVQRPTSCDGPPCSVCRGLDDRTSPRGYGATFTARPRSRVISFSPTDQVQVSSPTLLEFRSRFEGCSRLAARRRNDEIYAAIWIVAITGNESNTYRKKASVEELHLTSSYFKVSCEPRAKDPFFVFSLEQP